MNEDNTEDTEGNVFLTRNTLNGAAEGAEGFLYYSSAFQNVAT